MATAESSLRFNLFAKDSTGAGIHSAESNFSKFGKGLVTKFAAAGAAIGGISLLGDFISEAQESVRVGKLTENVIRSTGGSAKVTAKQVGDLATSISNKVGVDDEAIQSGENLLLTFTGIRNEVGKGNDIFNQASKAAVDMAAGLNNGQVSADNLKGTSIQLGKALNDPVKGITALSRAGVSFTEQQKNQIKAMVKSGDLLGAQKVILAEVNKEFGGAAAAAASPAQKAQVAWKNLEEQIGLGILPLFNKVVGVISSDVIPAVSKFVDNLQNGSGGFASFRAGLASVGNFITTQVVPALQRFGTWFTTVGWPAVQRFAQAFWADLQPALQSIVRVWQTNLQPALAGLILKFQEAWPTIQRVLTILGQVAGFILTRVVPVLIELYGKHLATTIRIFGQLFAVSWKVIGVLIDLGVKIGQAGAAFGRFAGAVGSAIGQAWNAVSSGIGKVVSTIGGLPGKALSAVGKMGSVLYNAGRDLIQGFINGIASKFGDVKNKLGDLTNKVTSWKGPPQKDRILLKPAGQSIIAGLVDGLKGAFPGVKAVLGDLTSAIQAKFDEAKTFSDGLRDTFRGLGNLPGIDTMLTDAQGNQTQGGLPALLAGLQKQASDAKAFAATVKRLRKAGLNEASLAGLRDAGPTGGLAAAQQLLAGGASAIGQVNSLQASLNETGRVFSNRETRANFGFSGTPNTAGSGDQKVELHVNLAGGGDKFMNWLRDQIRVKGGNVQLALGK